jgi:hypothetical protein
MNMDSSLVGALEVFIDGHYLHSAQKTPATILGFSRTQSLPQSCSTNGENSSTEGSAVNFFLFSLRYYRLVCRVLRLSAQCVQTTPNTLTLTSKKGRFCTLAETLPFFFEPVGSLKHASRLFDA